MICTAVTVMNYNKLALALHCAAEDVYHHVHLWPSELKGTLCSVLHEHEFVTGRVGARLHGSPYVRNGRGTKESMLSEEARKRRGKSMQAEEFWGVK